MKLGTKSLLFGGHQFILHPIFVTWAWRKLNHRWPTYKELLAIIVHDWGYWGCEMMDDENGERHPEWAAKFLHKYFPYWCHYDDDPLLHPTYYRQPMRISYFVKYHSRFLAKRDGVGVSPLCLADKYGVALMPIWMYVLLCKLSGEIWEYMGDEKYEINLGVPKRSRRSSEDFFKDYKKICAKWVSGEVPLEPWRK